MLLYNNRFILEEDLKLPITNRAFQYNDGFFETIMVVDGKLRFWRDHQERMQQAATALQLAMPDFFWIGELEEQLLGLAGMEQALSFGRLKLKVWRAGGGLYTPEKNQVEWLGTVSPAIPIPETPVSVGVCQSVRTCFSPLSHFKGPQAPLYVLAGMEKQARGFDDVILLNAARYVAEMISSNIFWLKKEVLYTPALATGCVDGILRRNILRWCAQQGIAVQEGLENPEALLEAESVFAANVTGIRSIIQLEDNQLQTNSDWLQRIKAGLQV